MTPTGRALVEAWMADIAERPCWDESVMAAAKLTEQGPCVIKTVHNAKTAAKRQKLFVTDMTTLLGSLQMDGLGSFAKLSLKIREMTPIIGKENIFCFIARYNQDKEFTGLKMI